MLLSKEQISKEQYYTRISTKSKDPTTAPKEHWPILKRILNNKKIPCITPIFHNNNYVTDFKKKVQIFNNFFAKQCTLVENTSKLPIDSL